MHEESLKFVNVRDHVEVYLKDTNQFLFSADTAEEAYYILRTEFLGEGLQ